MIEVTGHTQSRPHPNSQHALTVEMRALRRRRDDKPDFEKKYGITHSHISSYEQFFRRVNVADTMIDMVRRMPSPLVVDLMANPHTVLSLFREAAVRDGTGIVVNYGIKPSVKYNANSNVTTVRGDLVLRSTWRDIALALRGRHADLIMERAVDGLNNLPMHMAFFGATLRRAWRLLNPDGGTIMFQSPYLSHMEYMGLYEGALVSWARLLDENKVSSAMNIVGGYNAWAIMLRRHPESPKELPLLPKT